MRDIDRAAADFADMGARHAFLRAGFGFGNMPRFMVEDDIASGKLRVIRIELQTNLKPLMPMRAVYRTDARHISTLPKVRICLQ
jgi:DNA-binding transcriptional LysR family regulator